jgi:hypothetical protein
VRAFHGRRARWSAVCARCPVKNVLLGPELQWGKRDNFSDGFTSDDVRIQFSVKWNFSLSIGGQ